MYCHNCGNQISDQAVICINCGVATSNSIKEQYRPIIGFILSFIIPIAGLIVSIVEYRKAKEQNGDGSLAKAGIIISSIYCGIVALYIILIVAAIAAATSTVYYTLLPIMFL